MIADQKGHESRGDLVSGSCCGLSTAMDGRFTSSGRTHRPAALCNDARREDGARVRQQHQKHISLPSCRLSSHVHEDYSNALAHFGAYGFGVACLPFYQSPRNLTADRLLRWRNDFQKAVLNSSRLSIPVSFRAELLHSGAVPGSTVFPMPAL